MFARIFNTLVVILSSVVILHAVEPTDTRATWVLCMLLIATMASNAQLRDQIAELRKQINNQRTRP